MSAYGKIMERLDDYNDHQIEKLFDMAWDSIKERYIPENMEIAEDAEARWYCAVDRVVKVRSNMPRPKFNGIWAWMYCDRMFKRDQAERMWRRYRRLQGERAYWEQRALDEMWLEGEDFV